MPNDSSLTIAFTHRPSKGFTLLEILVVMLLIGIILGIAGLSVGDGGLAQRQKIEAQRLRGLLQIALDEALMTQSEIGLALSSHGYRFLAKHRDSWVPLADDLFMPRQLPAEMALVLEVEGLPVELGKASEAPQVILFSSAEVTPFRVWLLASEDQTVQEIQGSLSGVFILTPRDWNEVTHVLAHL